jgi:multidrug efflux system membrane fusion protein
MFMESNAPHSTALPNAHFRAPSRPVEQTRHGNAGWVIITLVVVAMLGIGVWALFFRGKAGGGAEANAHGGHGEIPVVAATVKQGDLPIYLTGLGTVTPFNLVTVRSRVEGQIMKIGFTEGQDVKEDDLLFEIDERPYQVQLEQAQGQKARDEALLNNAKADLARYQSAGSSVAQQQIDTAAALVRQYEATVQSDQAGIDSAQLNILYCKITAPITGRIGLRKVDIGNMVAANDPNGLAVITQLQPIAVIFSISQTLAIPVLQKPNGGIGLEVTAFDQGFNTPLATGVVSAIDNQVDPTTGTIKIKATIENKDRILFPNEFVNARLLVNTLKGATLVPAAAVQHGPDNEFVYVVKKDQTVEVRPVKVGPTTEDTTAIEDGVAPGETVVTDGVDKLQPGAKVAVREGKRGATTQGATTQPGAHGAVTQPPQIPHTRTPVSQSEPQKLMP